MKLKDACSLEGKLWQTIQRIKKHRYHCWQKAWRVKARVFPVVVYGCERWTIKKAEHWRIDAFKLWCWRRLLRVPWTARSNQSILKEINPEYSLEGLMLKLKLWYFGHLMWTAGSLEKTLMLGKIEGKRKRRQPRIRWLDSITHSTDMNLSKLLETVKDRGAWFSAADGVTKSQTQLSNWTTTFILLFYNGDPQNTFTVSFTSQNHLIRQTRHHLILIFMDEETDTETGQDIVSSEFIASPPLIHNIISSVHLSHSIVSTTSYRKKITHITGNITVKFTNCNFLGIFIAKEIKGIPCVPNAGSLVQFLVRD